MRVDDYRFGRIVIDGTVYERDVIVFPERVFHPWWRKEGHRLDLEDLVEILATPPRVLIIGNGYYGVMKVPQEVLDELSRRGIETRVARTRRAVEMYNEQAGPGVVGAFHLTC